MIFDMSCWIAEKLMACGADLILGVGKRGCEYSFILMVFISLGIECGIFTNILGT
jgi:hypothetical protein